MPPAGPQKNARLQNLNSLKIVTIELDNVKRMMAVDIDDETRAGMRATLEQCAEKLMHVSRLLSIKDAPAKKGK